MKAHIGMDSKQGIVHSLCSTAASVSGVHMLPEGEDQFTAGSTRSVVCLPQAEPASGR
jgi:hypothetical protein